MNDTHTEYYYSTDLHLLMEDVVKPPEYDKGATVKELNKIIMGCPVFNLIIGRIDEKFEAFDMSSLVSVIGEPPLDFSDEITVNPRLIAFKSDLNEDKLKKEYVRSLNNRNNLVGLHADNFDVAIYSPVKINGRTKIARYVKWGNGVSLSSLLTPRDYFETRDMAAPISPEHYTEFKYLIYRLNLKKRDGVKQAERKAKKDTFYDELARKNKNLPWS